MNNACHYIGKTLKELSAMTGMFNKPVHLFVLGGDNDRVGRRLMDVFALRQAVIAYPATSDAVVVDVSECCSELFLRVRSERMEDVFA